VFEAGQRLTTMLRCTRAEGAFQECRVVHDPLLIRSSRPWRFLQPYRSCTSNVCRAASARFQ
jgi:hypothetical protein